MLSPITIPGLFITATDTGVGKTMITAAIARVLRQQGKRVAVCKPIGSGCVHRREGLVSEDAEFLAHHSNTRHPLDLICPQRYAEPLAPSVAAERAGRPVDWSSVDRSLRILSEDADILLVEGIGGAMVPLDSKHTALDLARWLNLPAVIVARPSLGTINHTLLTTSALKREGVKVAGVIINRFPTDTPSLAEETNPRQIEKWANVPILAIVPDSKGPFIPGLPPELLSPLEVVDWQAIATR